MKQNVQQLASWLCATPALPQSDNQWLPYVEAITAAGLGGLALSRPSGGPLPAWVRRALQACASDTGTRNLTLLGELARIALAFERAGIPLMVLKGAALHLTVYARRDVRPMSDLDLLVRPEDADRAVDCLQSIGYQPGALLIRGDFFPRFHYEKELIGPGRAAVRVDLHALPWRPMHLAQAVPADEFWEGAIAVRAGQATVLIPHPATMLVHLAAHAAFHDFERYIWLHDLREVVARYGAELDWKRIVDCASRWHLGLAVQRALETAQGILGSFCPQSVMNQLSAAPASWRDRLTLWHTPRDAASPPLHVACNLLCLRGIRGRASYLAAVLWPDSGHLTALYRRRHVGWTLCAQGVRGLRVVGRMTESAWAIFQGLFGVAHA